MLNEENKCQKVKTLHGSIYITFLKWPIYRNRQISYQALNEVGAGSEVALSITGLQ